MMWKSPEDNLKAKTFTQIEGLNFNNHLNYDQLILDYINKVIKMNGIFKQ